MYINMYMRRLVFWRRLLELIAEYSVFAIRMEFKLYTVECLVAQGHMSAVVIAMVVGSILTRNEFFNIFTSSFL